MRRCAALLPSGTVAAGNTATLPLPRTALLLCCVGCPCSFQSLSQPKSSQRLCCPCRPAVQIDDEDEEAPKKRKRAESDDGAPVAAPPARVPALALPGTACVSTTPALGLSCDVAMTSAAVPLRPCSACRL